VVEKIHQHHCDIGIPYLPAAPAPRGSNRKPDMDDISLHRFTDRSAHVRRVNRAPWPPIILDTLEDFVIIFWAQTTSLPSPPSPGPLHVEHASLGAGLLFQACLVLLPLAKSTHTIMIGSRVEYLSGDRFNFPKWPGWKMSCLVSGTKLRARTAVVGSILAMCGHALFPRHGRVSGVKHLGSVKLVDRTRNLFLSSAQRKLSFW